MERPLAWQPGASLLELEREALALTLEKFGGNRAHAALALGLSISTIRSKIKRFGIKTRNPSGRPRSEKTA